MNSAAKPDWPDDEEVIRVMSLNIATIAGNMFQSILKNHVQRRPAPGCWFWVGDISAQGYGYMKPHLLGHAEAAHRYFAAAAFGPESIAGMEIHHRCEVKHCVNPAHLVPMTRQEHTDEHANLRRGKWPLGTCSGCRQTRSIKDGVIWAHGPWGRPCPGAGLPPVLGEAVS